MLKVVYLARRRPDVSHDELVTFWREVNVADVAAELRPDTYRVTFFGPKPAHDAHNWDGMAIVSFTDETRGRQVTEGLPAPARRNGFAEMLAEVIRFEVSEHVFFDRPGTGPTAGQTGVKLTFLVVPRPGVAHDRVVAHWVGVHGPAVAQPMAGIAGALRYVASPALERVGAYSGITELYYADGAASKAHGALLSEDGFRSLADNSIYLVGEELVVR